MIVISELADPKEQQEFETFQHLAEDINSLRNIIDYAKRITHSEFSYKFYGHSELLLASVDVSYLTVIVSIYYYGTLVTHRSYIIGEHAFLSILDRNDWIP